MSEVSNISQVIKQNILSEIEDDVLFDAVQADSKSALASDVDENSAAGLLAKTKKLVPETKVKSKHLLKAEKGFFTRKETDNLADGFSNREDNRDYHLPPSALSRLAISLGEVITPDTPYEEIVRVVHTELTEGKKNPDVSQVDKALDFLLEVVQIKLNLAEGLQATFLEKLHENIATTKIRHYEIFRAEIETAHNIIGAASALVTENRSTAESLDHLRKMINEPQDVHTKYKYYIEDCGYSYVEVRAEFKLLFHYMGCLVKKKLENPHLKQLLEEIKVLQSVLGVYKQSEREFNSMSIYLDRKDLFS